MSVVDSKEAAFRPSCWIFLLRSGHVQNNGNSIFIVISLNTLMSICGVACDQTMWLGGIFCIFEVFQRVCWGNCAFLWAKEIVIRLKSLVEGVDDVRSLVHQLLLSLLHFSFTFLNGLIVFTLIVRKIVLLGWGSTQSWSVMWWLLFRSGLWTLLSSSRTICARSGSQILGTSSFAVASLTCAWSDWCLTAEGRPPGRADHPLLKTTRSRLTATNSWTLFSIWVEEHLICGRKCSKLSSWCWPLVSRFGNALICASIIQTWACSELKARPGLLCCSSLTCVIHIHLVLRSHLQSSLWRIPLVQESSCFVWAWFTLLGPVWTRLRIILLISLSVYGIRFALSMLARKQVFLFSLRPLTGGSSWFWTFLVLAFLGCLFSTLIA